MQCNAMLLCSTPLHSTLLHSALLCSALLCSTLFYYTALYNICCTIPYYTNYALLGTTVKTVYYSILKSVHYSLLYTILYYPTNPRNVLCWFWFVLKDLQSLQSVFFNGWGWWKKKRLRFFAGPAALTFFYHVLSISITMVLENLSVQLLVSGYLSE